MGAPVEGFGELLSATYAWDSFFHDRYQVHATEVYATYIVHAIATAKLVALMKVSRLTWGISTEEVEYAGGS